MTDKAKPTRVAPTHRANERARDSSVLLLQRIRAELVRRAHATADAIERQLLTVIESEGPE